MTKIIEDKVHRNHMKKKSMWKLTCYQWELTAEINLPLKKRNSSLSIFVRYRHAIANRPAERLREMNQNKASMRHGTSVGTDGGLTYHHMN